jgi:hypothetical protein
MLNIKDINITKARKDFLNRQLLDKMMQEMEGVPVKQQKKQIKARGYKFDSLIIIDRMISGDYINGKVNTEVYEMYKYISDSLKLKTMTQIDFSHFICRYFDFRVVSERFGKDVKRVYRNKPATCLREISAIGIDEWNYASDEDKLAFIQELDAEDLEVCVEDYKRIMKFLLKQLEK